MYRYYKEKEVSISSPVLLKFAAPEKKRRIEGLLEEKEEGKNVKNESLTLAKEMIERARQVQREILSKTREDIEKMLKEAEERAHEIEEKYRMKGYEEGYSAGYEEGYKKGEEKAQALIEEAKALKEEILEEKKRLYKEAESDMINVILEAVEKIVGKHVEEDKDLILSLIKKGMENYNAFDKVTVRVSEEDYEHCVKNKDKILKDVEFLDEINIVKDLSLRKGDCIIETNSGVINSGVTTQLKTLKSLFAGVLNE
ncbi:flagellar biosynthesis protein [Caldanaerobacter subterraneus subsp. yonseiensis KB-1]|uniref:Flagellar biosynthesis protein n=1 Tax=Caldanaerobacter subterraneus subsp. yonseiensis KB-1 TaxID=1388761 RepID=U5CR78_CALSX|nr:flagellar assembly protein FliH [Caldanaerobacter subterraneus]ERM92289.1 flagellar biosynthesis protein [Caldanaerobacter subterraneus subsp. yonseiensis KB-1]